MPKMRSPIKRTTIEMTTLNAVLKSEGSPTGCGAWTAPGSSGYQPPPDCRKGQPKLPSVQVDEKGSRWVAARASTRRFRRRIM